MDTISSMFFRSAKMNSNKKAIWCDGQEMTYIQLAEFVGRYANYLSHHGVAYGDIIGIPMTNSIESVALMLTAATIGAGLAPINPTIPIDATKAQFSAGNVKHIIARKAFWKQMRKNNISVEGCMLCLDDEFEGVDNFASVYAESSDVPDYRHITGNETYILTMTSGSTGDPKPIELTQENKVKRIKAHYSLFKITPEDNVLAATPLYHSLAERLVLLPLLIGGTSILLPRFTPDIWLNCVRDQQVTFTIPVSAQLAQVAQLISSPFAPDITSLRCVVSSSALLEPHVRNELIAKLKCDFHEMYGTSEVSTATDIDFREAATKQRSVGRAIPQADIKIIRDDGTEAAINEIGEIIVKSELEFNGYYKCPDLTKAVYTKDGYFKTGDLGHMDSDKYLYYNGRKNEIIITGGINVYPHDIESALEKLEGVKECAAFPYPDERLGEVVALAIVPDEYLTMREVKIFCARNLADFQQPHKIFFLGELPKNVMGKLIKGKLPEAVAGMEG